MTYDFAARRAHRRSRRAAEIARDRLYTSFPEWDVEGILGLVQMSQEGEQMGEPGLAGRIIEYQGADPDWVEELLQHDLSLGIVL